MPCQSVRQVKSLGQGWPKASAAREWLGIVGQLHLQKKKEEIPLACPQFDPPPPPPPVYLFICSLLSLSRYNILGAQRQRIAIQLNCFSTPTVDSTLTDFFASQSIG